MPSSTSPISTTRSRRRAITSSRVGYTGVWPIGLYSKKYTKVADLPEGAVIGVPNDPSNEGRALRVLQNEGVIKLKDGTGILATTADIAENPKKVVIKELDAGIVGRSVEDLDAAVVNTDWALKSGLGPDNRIAQEPVADNPYRNFIAVKAGNENEPWVKTLGRLLPERDGQGRVRQGLQGHRDQRLLIGAVAGRNRRSATERAAIAFAER